MNLGMKKNNAFSGKGYKWQLIAEISDDVLGLLIKSH